MITALATIFVFGLIVFIHELGHFITAKLSGMRVDEFAIGFGPVLLKKQYGETLYSVRCIPLGGFNRIAGMTPDEPLDDGSFYTKPAYKKLIVIFSLAIMLIGLGTFSLIAPSVDFSFGGGSAANSATGSAIAALSDDEIESDITTLIKNYLDAKQKVSMDEMKECVSDISKIDEKRLVTEAEYIEEYKNIECTICDDGLSDGIFRVYVYYEAKIYDIDTLVPSLTALVVTGTPEGKFLINLSKIDSKDQRAIDKLDNSDEIKKKIDSVQKKLEDIVSKNADVRDFYQMLESTNQDSNEENNENIGNEAGSAAQQQQAADPNQAAPTVDPNQAAATTDPNQAQPAQ